MKYGTLTVICGPMYAGKTTETLKRVLWARHGQNRNVAVLKPSFDDRYAETEIVSHDGLKTSALSVSDLKMTITEPNSLIVLDEIQFFMQPHVDVDDAVAWVKRHLEMGQDVIAAGLDMNWRGEPFAVTAGLLAMADEVIKLTANCTVCGRKALKTYKIDATGGSVELGASDKYEARCNEHWVNRT